MSTVKITELTELIIPANTQNVILLAVDKSGSNPITRQVKLSAVGNTLNQISYYASDKANAAYNTANTNFIHLQSAYGQANTATSDASRADQRAVTSGNYANAAFDLANAAAVYVTSGGVYANAAYTKANVASIDALSAGSYANGAFSLANGVMLEVHTANTLAQSAFTLANSAWYNANSGFIKANSAYSYSTNVEANTVIIGSYANGAYVQANSALVLAANSNANSLIVVVSAPITNKGTVGDVKNMVYLANDVFYYCTSSYDGTTNIWSKIVSTDNW